MYGFLLHQAFFSSLFLKNILCMKTQKLKKGKAVRSIVTVAFKGRQLADTKPAIWKAVGNWIR